MKIILKKCNNEDLCMLRDLSIKTYYDTFAHLNTPEDMAAYLEDAFNEKRLAKELNDTTSSFFLSVCG